MDIDANPTAAAWDAAVAAQPHASSLQSWAWGEFQRALGRPVMRWLLSDQRGPLAMLQAIVHVYPLGVRSVYIPHGPNVRPETDPDDPAVWEQFCDVLGAFGRQVNAVFVRFEPMQAVNVAKHLPVRPVRSVQPSVTNILALTKGEQALLAGMHQKTRYNIRLAERSGVRIETGGAELLPDFLRLLSETQRRQNVQFFGPDYFQTLLATPAAQPLARIVCARAGSKTLAALLLFIFGDTVTYLHGGSSRDERQKMAPYLAHWAAIKDAAAKGARWYDFRGVAPADAPADHPWAGFSRFKRGFGGVDVAYPGASDWVRQPMLYSLYRIAQKVKP